VNLRSSLETDRIHADEDLLRRTLTNLVENAIRYAPSETSVTVAAARLAEGTDLRVADAGPGIPPEKREKVFDAFAQVEAGERVVARGSRGLGLTFCKVAVEAHGGSIWIEDAAPGAAFCMRFPHGR
jgi:K+-sensing histidine kinase KdpD